MLITFYLSNGSFPYIKRTIDCLHWEYVNSVSGKRENSSILIFIDKRFQNVDDIVANNYNLVLKGNSKEEINNAEDLKKIVSNNETFLINNIKDYDGNLAHLEVYGK